MPVDSIRYMLAVMDQNYHKDRHVATTLNDNPYLSKDKNKGCLQKTKSNRIFIYSRNILAMISWLELNITVITIKI